MLKIMKKQMLDKMNKKAQAGETGIFGIPFRWIILAILFALLFVALIVWLKSETSVW
jgi:hypothetical protein